MQVFKFAVDEDFAKEHNEMLRNTRSLVISGVSMFVLSLIGAVLVWRFVDASSPWHLLGSLGLLLFGIMMLIVALVIPRSVGKAQAIYDAHPLAPAVITDNEGTTVTITALVNANVDADVAPGWALASLVMKPIPNTASTKGTKVPVAAVGAQRSTQDREHWQLITPMPIAWATPDVATVDAARKSVPQHQWQILERAVKDRELVESSKNSLTSLRTV